MKPYYADDWLTILEGDCRAVLPSLPADSVDCVVTSPPYWGLRDYGTATWVGGDEACDHSRSVAPRRDAVDGVFLSTRGEQGARAALNTEPFRDTCGKCGAQRVDSQLGLERTPEEYVANMVAVFAEVRRVLKPSGTCWLNLGDSYNGSSGSGGATTKQATNVGSFHDGGIRLAPGLKPKDLVGIPWRVAFALQADGWYLRSDIIWSKPNPMPESVTDRPTKAHEYLFLLTKSARYYFDPDAVREPLLPASVARGEYGHASFGKGQFVGSPTDERHQNGKQVAKVADVQNPAGRNIRSVWTIATRPYPGAHFAVFPPELPERCIKAGSSERGVCPECGAPWERVVEREATWKGPRPSGELTERNVGGRTDGFTRPADHYTVSVTTTGWRPTCSHSGSILATCDEHTGGFCQGAAHHLVPHPAVVLDIFAGSGTVGLVANRLSRRAILIDLNPEYLRQQMTRNAQTPLGLGAA